MIAYTALLDKAIVNPEGLSTNDVMALLTPPSLAATRRLWQTAHLLRLDATGKCIHLRAIIEFSNYCRQDCLYCGLRQGNRRVARYRMTPDAIVEAAIKAHKAHQFGTYVLQSGEDPGYDLEDLEWVVQEIKLATNAAVTLSIGERSYGVYQALQEAGADRFLLKFETSDGNLFRKLKPTTTLEQRLGCLDTLRGLGYQTGSGIILGLPGQDLESVASDLLLCRDADYEMVSIGPFIPHPDTPLGSVSLASNVCSTLTTIAVARLLVPNAHMPATTALGVIGQNDKWWKSEAPKLQDARSLALMAGANVLMLDVTPAKYRASYSIYPGKASADGDVICDSIWQTKQDVSNLSMTICPGRGDSPKQPWGRGSTDVKREGHFH
ncbi:MAG: [FeFe] hydrogenase H-cluster radical SAM maturase HydE [Firmicutes bacterium]|nr:[FeFe] hydrogenase H-cluster radical SAM maturase HydE [Bacillota bacterium]